MNEDTLLCPTCETDNDALNQTCAHCGQSLIVVCPRCNTVNAINAEQCFACGQHFDALGQIMARHELRQGDRFTRQAADAIEIQQAEKAQGQARTDQMWEVERQRQAALIAQKREQQKQEKQLIVGAVIAAIVVVVIVIIIAATR
jgi:predicted amidophosphoribosyltransferase